MGHLVTGGCKHRDLVLKVGSLTQGSAETYIVAKSIEVDTAQSSSQELTKLAETC